jgi:hypothetical protein
MANITNWEDLNTVLSQLNTYLNQNIGQANLRQKALVDLMNKRFANILNRIREIDDSRPNALQQKGTDPFIYPDDDNASSGDGDGMTWEEIYVYLLENILPSDYIDIVANENDNTITIALKINAVKEEILRNVINQDNFIDIQFNEAAGHLILNLNIDTLTQSITNNVIINEGDAPSTTNTYSAEYIDQLIQNINETINNISLTPGEPGKDGEDGEDGDKGDRGVSFFAWNEGSQYAGNLTSISERLGIEVKVGDYIVNTRANNVAITSILGVSNLASGGVIRVESETTATLVGNIRGTDGITPTIDPESGNWIINNVITNYPSTGGGGNTELSILLNGTKQGETYTPSGNVNQIDIQFDPFDFGGGNGGNGNGSGNEPGGVVRIAISDTQQATPSWADYLAVSKQVNGQNYYVIPWSVVQNAQLVTIGSAPGNTNTSSIAVTGIPPGVYRLMYFMPDTSSTLNMKPVYPIGVNNNGTASTSVGDNQGMWWVIANGKVMFQAPSGGLATYS